MKSRDKSKKPAKKDYRSFAQAILAIQTPDECQRFLDDLCTPAELEALVDRWRAVQLLKEKYTYREIAEETGISVTTVGRVARCLEMGSGGYESVHQRLNPKSRTKPKIKRRLRAKVK